MFVPEPVTLAGRVVRLEPLADRHAEELLTAAADDAIWSWMPTPLQSQDAMRSWIAAASAEQAAGVSLPFAIIEAASGRAVGSTRFMDIRPAHRGVEIGWTWLNPAVWRTPLNTEAKYLLLRHAFETWKCIRVQLKTDRRNERSRAAILRFGAQFEGILRHHMILPNGDYRDSAYYSVTDLEWPAVKSGLEARMAR